MSYCQSLDVGQPKKDSSKSEASQRLQDSVIANLTGYNLQLAENGCNRGEVAANADGWEVARIVRFVDFGGLSPVVLLAYRLSRL